jgi:dihydrofolate reductase
VTRLSIVVAVADNGVIGKDNALLWRLPDDLKYFKAITMGKPIVMGRKTFESIGRPLPGRTNIVVSRQVGLSIPGCTMAVSLEHAIQIAGDVPDIMIVGGAEIYRLALPFVDTVYLTEVHASFDGDVTFPALDASEWLETHREDHAMDEKHAHAFTFVTLQRRAKH